MKRNKFLVALLLFSATAFGIFSCKKQSTIEGPVEMNKIERLAAEFTQPIGENYASLKTEYSNLNESELRAFCLNIYRINNQKAKSGMSEEQFLKQFEEYNKSSAAQFGKAFNKIPIESLAKVVSTNQGSRSSLRPIDPPPDPNCPYLPYPLYYYWGDDNAPYSDPFVSWRLVDFYDGDCDGYELTYNGWYSRLRPLTAWGAQSVALFLQGDHLSDPTRTRVLHKKSSADWWFGNVYGINDHIRMAMQYDE